MFDTAASGWFSSFVLSLIITIIGLQLTADSTPDIIATYPTIPAVLLRANPLAAQLFSSQFPNMLMSEVPKDSLVHLHWLGIAGICYDVM